MRTHQANSNFASVFCMRGTSVSYTHLGGAVHAAHLPALIRDSVLIGVDLGPNLSVTGSLATVLWLIALRREGEQVTAWRFLRMGALVMPPALLVSIVALWVVSR